MKTITCVKTLLMKKILIADDDPAIRDVFKVILETSGYEVEAKENGSEIIENNFTIPDLFLIDRLLSGIDGLDICRYLKDNVATKNIPVVMISASSDIAAASAKAGADDYIEKPFDLSHLLSVIERNINKNSEESLIEVA